jgi:hypothetical protein
MKLTGKPNVVNPRVGFDEAGTGNRPNGTAPVLDPTSGSDRGESPVTYPIKERRRDI